MINKVRHIPRINPTVHVGPDQQCSHNISVCGFWLSKKKESFCQRFIKTAGVILQCSFTYAFHLFCMMVVNRNDLNDPIRL